jgi:hypothetical protein
MSAAGASASHRSASRESGIRFFSALVISKALVDAAEVSARASFPRPLRVPYRAAGVNGLAPPEIRNTALIVAIRKIMK